MKEKSSTSKPCEAKIACAARDLKVKIYDTNTTRPFSWIFTAPRLKANDPHVFTVAL